MLLGLNEQSVHNSRKSQDTIIIIIYRHARMWIQEIGPSEQDLEMLMEKHMRIAGQSNYWKSTKNEGFGVCCRNKLPEIFVPKQSLPITF